MTGPTILVTRFGALGDVILTTPLLRAIGRTHPDARITYVTKRAYAPLLERDPHVARVVALEPGETVRSLARRLGRRWDHRIDLHGSLRSKALQLVLGGRWGTWSKRRGRRALTVWLGVPPPARPIPVAERYFEAARALGVAPDDAPAAAYPTPGDDARAAALMEGARGYVALCPGAQHWNKRWPPAHWRALAHLLMEAGEAVVGIGTPEERLLLDTPGVLDAFGTDLPTAAALLRDARVTVANDSGLMHLATAMRTPVVALFGPTSPALGYAPYRNTGRVLERALPCRPCSAIGGPLCPMRHHRCMIEIGPADVAAAVRSFA